MAAREVGMQRAAIIIGGAVAKGAFAAGALEVLVGRLGEANTPIARLVGTSSGALNAVFLAAGVRAGDPSRASRKLVRLWTKKATALRFLDPRPSRNRSGPGLSSMTRVADLLEANAPTSPDVAARKPVEVRVVTTPLAGIVSADGSGAGVLTSFEKALCFQGTDFEDGSRRREMFEAACASAAFPLLFRPPWVPDLGPCVDGGIVDNTPVKAAIEDTGDEVTEVFVVAAEPANLGMAQGTARAMGSAALLGRLVEIAIYERLQRDLREARKRNAVIEKLQSLKGSKRNPLTDGQLEAVYGALGWTRHRKLSIVEIRPQAALRGSPVSGFVCRGLREEYVAEGRTAARRALGIERGHGCPGSRGAVDAGGS